MANLCFSILSPDACVHWDGARLTCTPGVDRSQAPGEDRLEEYWRTYYGSIFNPARLNSALMAQHMPRAYWRNLPEAAAIPHLVDQAKARTATMVQAIPSEPSKRAQRIAARQSRDAPADTGIAPAALEDIAAAVQVCRRCDLWRDATQGVPGEGPRRASLMFVGEQPGDQEDLAGHPFVGPAGAVLDKALAEAGVPRSEAFVTNAVKHFKHELRGKRRLQVVARQRAAPGEAQGDRRPGGHGRRLPPRPPGVGDEGARSRRIGGRSPGLHHRPPVDAAAHP
jgi:DNA polymerase